MQTQDIDLPAVDATLHRGISAARAGLRSVAAAQFERAAEAAPDDANVWLWLAWVGSSPDNTIRCLEQVLQLSPGHTAAMAGLTWARALASDAPAIPVAMPVAMSVAKRVENPIVNRVEAVECNMMDSESQVRKSLAAMTELVQEFDATGIAPTIPAETSPTLIVEPKPDLSENEVDVIATETPAEPRAEVTRKLSEDFTRVGSYRRRWSDLVPSDSVPQTDASAWPSLVPPPLPSRFSPSLPSMIPPPLPAATNAEAPVELEPLTSSEDSEPVDQKSPTPMTSIVSASEIGVAHEASADVEALTTSFRPRPTTEAVSVDDRKLVMVVDDSPTVRKLVSLTLERRGYRVISAFDGVAAIKELGACRPDLILLDINMPRLDGYRLCKLIKKHEATQTIPVVMLSGKDGMFDKLRGRLVGCSDYITKPFEADSLSDKVAKYLNPVSTSL